MSVEFLTSIIPMLFRGLKLTMLIAVVGILLGFVMGSISGYALQCKNKVARTIANIYIWIIRVTFYHFRRRYHETDTELCGTYLQHPSGIHSMCSFLSDLIVCADDPAEGC